MSKSVRLKEHLAAEVERLAQQERRSLASMVELLLEQALKLPEWAGGSFTVRSEGGAVLRKMTAAELSERGSGTGESASLTEGADKALDADQHAARPRSESSDDVKPDFKGKKK